MKFKPFIVLSFLLTASWALAVDLEDYVTPDTWSKNITANGVKASSGGITLGETGGNLTIGLTTRYQIKIADDSDSKGFQYLRARLSDTKIGDGTMDVNLNMRVGVDFNPRRDNPREYFIYYDGLNVEAGRADAAFRLYQGNVVLNEVVGNSTITLGRAYLSNLGEYQIDGGNISYSFLDDMLTAYVFYGLPVSYYSNLKTQVIGGGLDLALFNGLTRLRAEYNFFIDDDDRFEKNTNVIRARLDQQVFFANVYGEIDQIHSATVYKVGADGFIDATGTTVSIFLNGQYDWNDEEVNPYVSSFETVTGRESQYVMWGVQLYQGLTPYLALGAGFESRYNFDEDYADQDFYRIYGNVDLIGLIHSQNFLSIIADYYMAPSYRDVGKSSKLLIGGRMSQNFSENIAMWAGVNVANYKYKANPIQLNPIFATNLTEFDYSTKDESTTAAYIGGQWSPKDWLMLQADYTFEVTNLFNTYDSDYDNCHTIALWLNLLW